MSVNRVRGIRASVVDNQEMGIGTGVHIMTRNSLPKNNTATVSTLVGTGES